MQEPQGRGPIEVTVEIPSGSRNKYEFDHARGRFVLDRVLSERQARKLIEARDES